MSLGEILLKKVDFNHFLEFGWRRVCVCGGFFLKGQFFFIWVLILEVPKFEYCYFELDYFDMVANVFE